MGCKVTQLGPDILMWECSINEHALFVWQYEQECIAYELRRNREDEQELPWREEDMYYAREDVDPFWPAEGVEQFQEIDVEMVPIGML